MNADSVSSSIKKVKTTAVLQKVFGWIIAIFNGLIAFVGLTQIHEFLDVAMVFFFGVLTALGILLIIKGSKKTKLIKTFYDYSARLAIDTEKSIDFLASSIGVTSDTALKNISDMIAYGFFPNCFLDRQHNRLVFPNTPQFQTTVPPAQTAKPLKHITVKCKGCGATNTIVPGTVKECEYCGSPL